MLFGSYDFESQENTKVWVRKRHGKNYNKKKNYLIKVGKELDHGYRRQTTAIPLVTTISIWT